MAGHPRGSQLLSTRTFQAGSGSGRRVRDSWWHGGWRAEPLEVHDSSRRRASQPNMAGSSSAGSCCGDLIRARDERTISEAAAAWEWATCSTDFWSMGCFGCSSRSWATPPLMHRTWKNSCTTVAVVVPWVNCWPHMVQEAHTRLSAAGCVLTAHLRHRPPMSGRGVEMSCVRAAAGISVSSSRLIGRVS